VSDQLIVPATLTRLDVQREKTSAEKVVAGSEATVIILRGPVGRDIYESEIGIGGERGPG